MQSARLSTIMAELVSATHLPQFRPVDLRTKQWQPREDIPTVRTAPAREKKVEGSA
jgi:hypothetical protein